jgi:hypothetical protein
MIRLPDEVPMRAANFASVVLSALAIATGAGMACGGAADTGLFGGNNSSSNGNDGGVTLSDGGGVTHFDSSTGGEDSGTVLPDAGQDKDTGAPPPKDGGGPPPVDPGVQCGGAECSVPSNACCRKQVANNFTYTCLPTGQCQGLNVPSLEIPCDDATDCTTAGHPGQVCCATVGGGTAGNAASEVLCRDPSECTQANSRTPLCDKNDPNACPAGTSCRMSTQTLPGYNLCF